ncbi:hypothetical protein [Succinimonas amylolytica]|uniref:capsular polysaccharide export protein, LipB/KpsS family n=1 Tax=Succinimonas amylolytica TaxID=83769 RepID=UPI0023A7A0CF
MLPVIPVVIIMPEEIRENKDIYHQDFLRCRSRSFLFLKGPPGSFFYKLGSRLFEIGYEVSYLNFSGGDVFDRPCLGKASCFRGKTEQWEKYLGDFVARKRITDIVLYDPGCFYHAVARILSQRQGIRVWVYDILRDGTETVILHRNPDDEIVIPNDREDAPVFSSKSDTGSENGEQHSLATVFYGGRSLFSRGSCFWNRLGTALMMPFFRHYVPQSISTGAAGPFSGSETFFFFPVPLSSLFRTGSLFLFKSAEAAITGVIESFAHFSAAGDHLVVRICHQDESSSRLKSHAAELSRKLDVSSRIHFSDCTDFDLTVRKSAGVVAADFYDGLRALILGRPVIALGAFCYTGSGLAVTACSARKFNEEALNVFWKNPPEISREALSWLLGTIRERYLISEDLASGEGMRRAVDLSLERLGIGGIRHCLIFSRPIARINNIRLFLDSVDTPAVVGWGHKPTASRARRYARRHGLPYYALEDGFIKSVATRFRGRDEEIVSLVFDRTGIYYDVNSDSELEHWMIRNAEWFTAELEGRARRLIECILNNRIVKYNVLENGKNDEIIPDIPDDAVLIIDQTFKDASIPQGNADAGTFREMLEEAVSRVGAGRVYVKEHPNVISGMGRGYYSVPDLKRRGVNIIASAVNALDLLRHFKNVYVATSGTGFEALLSGCRVTCFGEPFYSGYGLTDDRKRFARGKRLSKMKAPASLELLVAAVFYRYCIFVNPVTQRICAPEEALEYILACKNKYRHDPGAAYAPENPE